MYRQNIILAAHKHSIRHRQEVLQSDNCGCFYCQTVFEPANVMEWTDEEQTALCPNCEIDAIIGDKSGFNVTDSEFLIQMHQYWF
jgi:hypothetical protein